LLCFYRPLITLLSLHRADSELLRSLSVLQAVAAPSARGHFARRLE